MGFEITGGDQQNFEQQGYLLLSQVIPAAQLEALRQECHRFIQEEDAAMDAQEVDNINLSFRGSRYFLAEKLKQSRIISEVVFSEPMATITRALLGPSVYFFLDQLVIKGPETGMSFSWHQDSGYIPFGHTPYLTCWLPLDDVNETNGTVYLLSYDEAQTKTRVEHTKDETIKDQVGYFGDKPGTPANLKAGDMAVFSSTVFHRSGTNRTNQFRRVLLMQYSSYPICNLDGQPRHWVEPFWKDGKQVA